jgi:tRNA(Arg) A34 adenosine deaminase TadA
MTGWADVDAPWRAALELAWAAYAAGTIPVGAVVVGASGCVVAKGENAVYRPDADTPLAGSRLGHAEVAALGDLSSENGHEELALYSTLEPCLLCAGAAVMSNVGRVHFAGVDPYGGATPFPRDLNAHVRRARTAFCGPLDDDVGLFAAAIHVDFFLREKPDGNVVAAYAEHAPAAAAAGRAFARLALHEAAAAGTPLSEAFDAAVASLH